MRCVFLCSVLMSTCFFILSVRRTGLLLVTILDSRQFHNVVFVKNSVDLFSSFFFISALFVALCIHCLFRNFNTFLLSFVIYSSFMFLVFAFIVFRVRLWVLQKIEESISRGTMQWDIFSKIILKEFINLESHIMQFFFHFRFFVEICSIECYFLFICLFVLNKTT